MELTKPKAEQHHHHHTPRVWYHVISSQRPRPKPIRCTRPEWGPRIAWAAILISGGYLAARIVPALIAGVN